MGGVIAGVNLTGVQCSSVRDDAGVIHPRLVRVSWACAGSVGESFVVQVYVDGLLAGATSRAGDRRLLVGMDRHRDRVVQLLAVSPADRLLDLSSELDSGTYGQRLGEVQIARDETWPDGATLELQIDGVVRASRIVWLTIENRPGFGSFFGRGDFGLDGVGGLGMGEGTFGDGPFGFDAAGLRWVIDDEVADGPVGTVIVKDTHGLVVATIDIDLPVIGSI